MHQQKMDSSRSKARLLLWGGRFAHQSVPARLLAFLACVKDLPAREPQPSCAILDGCQSANIALVYNALTCSLALTVL